MPIVGETTGERPYLNYGLGDDRLGGAKFAFLPAGVRMMITGKDKGQFRVALAPGHEAWVPESMVTLLPAGTPPPSSLTGAWTVSGDRRFDYVTVNLSERLPFSSFVEYQPTRICIDVYGAVSNSNWITHHLSAKEIRNVSYQQAGAQVFRIILELAHRQVWGYEISYRGNALQVKVRRPPASAAWDNLTIALDAGHGGSNDGALGSTGLKEKDVNLAAVLRLKEILEDRGARVVLTRPDDRELPNSERLTAVLSSDADILLSVHANSIGDGSNPELVRGTSTYYRHLCYRPLSLAIYEELLGTGLLPFGNVGGFNFTLNSPTELPNALVELAFMSNPEDEMLLMDDESRTLFAEKIADGLERFLEQSLE
jgi:N-acetylmuramoyl-L-alanine amidase